MGPQVEPPDILQDMRFVSLGHEPETRRQRWLADLQKERPEVFLARLLAAEKDWSVAQGRGVNTTDTPAEAAEDAGADRALQLIERLLAEGGE